MAKKEQTRDLYRPGRRFVLLVLALGLVIVGGFLLLLNQEAPTDEPLPAPKPASEPEPTSRPEPAPEVERTSEPAEPEPAPEPPVVPAADTTAPTLESAVYDGSNKVLTVTFSENLKTPAPPGRQFRLSVDGTYFDTPLIGIDGAAVALTFPADLIVSPGTPLELFYSPPASDANPLQDLAGNLVAEFSNQSVACTNKPPPQPSSEPGDGTTNRCSSPHYRKFSSDPCDQPWQVPCSWTPERGCLNR